MGYFSGYPTKGLFFLGGGKFSVCCGVVPSFVVVCFYWERKRCANEYQFCVFVVDRLALALYFLYFFLARHRSLQFCKGRFLCPC